MLSQKKEKKILTPEEKETRRLKQIDLRARKKAEALLTGGKGKLKKRDGSKRPDVSVHSASSGSKGNMTQSDSSSESPKKIKCSKKKGNVSQQSLVKKP